MNERASAFGLYRGDGRNDDVVWVARQPQPMPSIEPLKVTLIHASDSVSSTATRYREATARNSQQHKRVRDTYVCTIPGQGDRIVSFPVPLQEGQKGQMLTPASVSASTSTAPSSLPIRQPQAKHSPIRIAQPPHGAPHIYMNGYGTMPQTSQRYPQAKSAYDDACTNYTTVFHANPANGLTTMGGDTRQNYNTTDGNHFANQPPVYRQPPLRQKQQQFHQQQPHHTIGGSISLSNIGSSGCTSFPASNSVDESTTPNSAYVGNAPTSQLPHFHSVPALGVRQQQQPPPLQPKHSAQSSTSSLLRHQRVPPPPSEPQNHSAVDLFDTACAQQRQIDANRGELEERRRLISATIAASSMNSAPSGCAQASNGGVVQQVHALKAQIARDEVELAQLSAVQREAREQSAHNQQQRQELQLLEKLYAQDDAQLRQAVGRVDTLKKQLDLLYQRRAIAASAAIAQQRKVNAQIERAEQNQQQQKQLGAEPPPYAQLPPSQKQQYNARQQHSQQPARPQASVGPFQFNLPNGAARNPEKSTSPLKKEIPIQRCYDESQRYLARGKPDQVSLRADSLSAIKRRSWAQISDDGTHGVNTSSCDNIWRYLIDEQRKGRTHVSFADIMAARNAPNGAGSWQTSNSTMSNLQSARQNEPQTEVKLRVKPIVDVLPLQNDKSQTPLEKDRIAERTTSPTREAEHEQHENSVLRLDQQAKLPSNMRENETGVTDAEDEEMRNESGSDDTSNTTTIEPDEENEGSPTMDEAFRHQSECRSHEAVNESTREKSDSEVVTKVENSGSGSGEQSKGDEEDETTVIAKATMAVVQSVSETETDDKRSQAEISDKSINGEKSGETYLKPQCFTTGGKDAEEEENDDGFIEETPEYHMPGIDDDGSTTSDEASSTISADNEPVFDENSICVTSNSQHGCAMPKGILRTPVATHHKRRVVFDQTVLFLDVAYGGEYDMLVELAAKIPDISVSNGEGITALHNAICAGNQDIVNFLIENHADVNALDLDGWSPLHCAASCNNIVMLRQLVENGACVFATTLSKAETASDLFEETHEPFESGADYIQHVENCMGIVNDAKIYAAFSYDAENDDELSFEEGDELRVIDRFDQLCSDEGERSDAESDNISDTDSYDSGACEGESSWWLCERTSDSARGLVPRNYISLYPKWKFRERYGFRPDTRITLPPELAGVRTVAQRRRRRRRQLLAEQQQDEHFMLLQWSNLSAAAASAAGAVQPIEKVSETIPAHQSSNSVIVNDDECNVVDSNNSSDLDNTKL